MKKLNQLIAAVCCMATFGASAQLINFNDHTIDSFGGSQDKTGSATVSVDGSTLTLEGNVWKSISVLGDFDIASDTVLSFDFFSDVEGEIHGLGFTNGSGISGTNTFRVFGNSNYGIDSTDTYDIADGWYTFNIDVGSFYTGTFDTFFFIMDNDTPLNGVANSSFRNVNITETASAISEPSILMLCLVGMFAMARRRV